MTAIGAKFKLFLKCENFILGNQSCYTVARGYILIMFSDGSIKYNQTSVFHVFDWLPELSVFVSNHLPACESRMEKDFLVCYGNRRKHPDL